MLETIFQMTAPDHCANCNAFGAVVCDKCAQKCVKSVHPTCYRCNKLTKLFKTCHSCRASTSIFACYRIGYYDGLLKALIVSMKFSARRSVARHLGAWLGSAFPCKVDVVCPLPTDPRHIRQRGYDHCEEIAKQVALQLGSPFERLLARVKFTQQRGATRFQRRIQSKELFGVRDDAKVFAKEVLLVDDVLSTGATLEAAAGALKKAGARRVYVAVIAHNR